MTLLTVLHVIAGALLAIAAGLAVIRIVRGPTILDRMIASDVLLTILILVVGAEMVIDGHTRTIPLMLVLTGAAAFATISVARYVTKQDRGWLVIGMILDIAAAVLLIFGGILSVAAGVGLLRFPDALSRLHAGTKPQILGLICVVLAIALGSRSWPVLLLLVPVVLFQLLTQPVAAHMVGRAGYRTSNHDEDLLVVDELAEAIERAAQDVDASHPHE